MKFIEFFERPVRGKIEAPAIVRKTDDFLADLPADQTALDMVIRELSQLNADEVSRFDSWTAKGTAMLGASGLLLALSPLGLSFIRIASGVLTWPRYGFWLAMVSLFLITIGLFFLATWNSLVSLRARPICRLDEDEWTTEDEQSVAVLRRTLAANKLTTYKNNIDITNLKGIKVNEAWKYFFLGCLAETLFVALAILMQAFWQG